MKVDYDKFPEIPEGCQLNSKPNRPNEFQVFRESRGVDPVTGKKKTIRETIGLIRDGVFSFSSLWLERQEHQRILEELEKYKKIALSLGREQEVQAIAEQVHERIHDAVQDAHLETRTSSRKVYPLEPIVIGALTGALSGASSCADIAQVINSNKNRFSFYFKDIPYQDVSHDIVYRAFMKVDVGHFDDFYQDVAGPMIQKTKFRIISGDGQAVRATTQRDPNSDSAVGQAYMLMNFYDSTNHVCLAQRLIPKKTNEITVGPKMVKNLDVRDAVVTTDAMSCQVGFIDAVIEAGADYCVSLKGNQDKSWSEVSHLFATTHPDQVQVYSDQEDLAHGRIEQRTVSVIRGALLSAELRQKWRGLEDGCVIRVRRNAEFKRGGKKTSEDSYYISSIPPLPGAAERLCEIIRAHWSVENRLHWLLDVNFNQDRMQATDETYITNRAALNKLALAMLEHYRYWLWEKGIVKTLPSIRQMQMRCRNFDEALQCIACSQGLLSK